MASNQTEGNEVLTEERKQELLEAARAQANEAVPPSTQKLGPDMEPAPTLQETQTMERPIATATPAGFIPGSDELGEFKTPIYGPYNDYTIVPTQWGEFGVPKGELLWFDRQPKFSPKSGEFVLAHLPRHARPDDAPEAIQAVLTSA